MRILVVGGLASSLVNFREALLRSMVERGHEVHAAAPLLSKNKPTVDRVLAIGVIVHDVDLQRSGMNPLKDLATLLNLVRIVRRVRPDVMLNYTIKPVIWGTLAGSVGHVPHRFALVTGLGYAFTGPAGGKRWLAQTAARWLYRLAMRRASKVFFQNPDDVALLRELEVLRPQTRVAVVNGSGVDTHRFSPAPLPTGPISFLLVARLLGDKGIREFIAAAKQIKASNPEVMFHLVGPGDPSPDAISAQELADWQRERTVTWHGPLDDVRGAFAAAHVYVLPSYREGTPRTVLEAMAMGRPVITTDAPGCRETVVHGENGFLVPPGEVDPLAAAMRRFIRDPALIPSMGQRSRRMAEEKYDVHKVNAAMLREMGL